MKVGYFTVEHHEKFVDEPYESHCFFVPKKGVVVYRDQGSHEAYFFIATKKEDLVKDAKLLAKGKKISEDGREYSDIKWMGYPSKEIGKLIKSLLKKKGLERKILRLEPVISTGFADLESCITKLDNQDF